MMQLVEVISFEDDHADVPVGRQNALYLVAFGTAFQERSALPLLTETVSSGVTGTTVAA